MHFQALMTAAPFLLGAASALPASQDAGLSKRELVFTTGLKNLDCSATQKYRIRKTLENVQLLTLTAINMKRSDPAYEAYFDGQGDTGKKDVFDNVMGRFKKINEFVEASIKSLDPDANKPTTKYETVQIICPADEDFGNCKTDVASTADKTKDDPAKIIFCPAFWSLVPGSPKKLGTTFTKNNVEFDICKQPTKMADVKTPEIPVLHELTHLTSLSNGRPRTIDCVYGAYWPAYLAAFDAEVAERNAENYPYAALSKYFGEMCDMQTETFTQDAPYPSRKGSDQPMGIEKDQYDLCKLPGNAGDVLPKPKSKVTDAVDKVKGVVGKIVH